MRYPAPDRRLGLEGKVLFKIRISNGNIDSLQLISGVSSTIDVEASRVLLLTNKNWLIHSDNFYLISISFQFADMKRPSEADLANQRSRFLQSNELEDAKAVSEEIKRRNPLDVENLEILINLYSQLNQTDASNQTRYLKSQVQKLTLITYR
jgi:hypothetical protein